MLPSPPIMKSLPRINWPYWLTLCMASTFGTNTGDFVSEYLHIGNLQGLPWLAAAIAAVFVAERLSSWASPLFFWLVIILVRTAATNLGDAFHDFGFGFGSALLILLICFAASVRLYVRSSPPRAGNDTNVRVSPAYWLCMILAGTLGTVGGDFVSFGIGLKPWGTAFAIGVLVILALAHGRKGRWLRPVDYWVTLALIRTAGTGLGDALGHGRLALATAINGAIFFGMVIWFYVARTTNQAAPAPVALARMPG